MNRESIRKYAQRWRDLAEQVHPLLLDKEMVTLFANTLRAPYYEHVMGRSAKMFIDVIVVVERIEQGIRIGRVPAPVEKNSFEVKRKVSILKMTTRVGKTHPKTTILHHKLPTSKNLSPKTFKPKMHLKISQKEITRKPKNNYLRYLCL